MDHDVGNYPGDVSEVNPQAPKYPLFGWCPENTLLFQLDQNNIINFNIFY